jgi:carbon storage regulator CsrA
MADLPRIVGAAVVPRRVGQELLIGDAICVTVVSAENGKAILAVRAPRNLSVDRAERRDPNQNDAGQVR